jgi:hypothetical protein
VTCPRVVSRFVGSCPAGRPLFSRTYAAA